MQKDFIGIEERNTFQMGKVTMSMIKCAYRFNYQRLRDTMIYNHIVEAQCLRRKLVETQDYATKCSKTFPLRKEFAKELLLELISNKLEDSNADEIIPFEEDVARLLRNEEEEEHKTNQ